jgi:GxGYxYP putative glycoside hydrolase C-terminal domain/GxGYxY sequence motif in domain of unknown function N-terminal
MKMKHLILLGLFLLAFPSVKAAGVPAEVSTYDFSGGRALSMDDARKLRREYDEGFLISSLEGLVNRKEPRLFVRCFASTDDFWWARMNEKGAWLAGVPVKKIATIKDLLAKFAQDYKGAVVYDESVPATSNLAATIAGADDLLVLRYDTDPNSLYHELTTGDKAIPIKVRLINEDGTSLFTGKGTIPDINQPSSGSPKNDAYRWLIEKYLKAGKLEPTELGYYIDCFWLKAHPGYAQFGDNLANLDYMIAHRGVVYDLDVFGDETPVDDRHQEQGTDLATLKLLLSTCNKLTQGRAMINIHGMVPWAYKYTDAKTATWDAGGTHDPVPSEWAFVQTVSAYNVAADCDVMADMANASFYQHYPLPAHIAQKAPQPTKQDLIKQGVLAPDGNLLPVNYYAFYVGDYDAAAWLYQNMPTMWTDPARGKIPLSWAINPNLADRFPFAVDWVRKTATPNDFFVAGDDGAGYLNPGMLTEPRDSELPSGVAIWQERNARYFKQWDLDTVGFIIDGNCPFMEKEALDAYAKFSPGGLVCQNEPPDPIHNGMPLLKMSSIVLGSPDVMVKLFSAGGPHFIAARTVLWTPTNHADAVKQIDATATLPHKLVDLRTLLQLYKYSKTGSFN